MDLNPSGRPVDAILGDACAGKRISAGDAHTLLLDADLLELGTAAQRVRDRFNDPKVASYNIDRNINYTNVCVYKCRFCAFYREPGDAEGYLLPFEEIGQKIEETLALNGTGILMQGGFSNLFERTIPRYICMHSRRRRSSSSPRRSD
jgi:cyclic dehypoxanthinyl futalosine synthase